MARRRELSLEVHVEAQAGDLWEVLTDLEHMPEWNKHVVEVRAPRKIAVGSSIVIRTKLGSRVLESDAEITVMEPPHRFEWRHTRDLIDGKPVAYVKDGVTRFTLTADGDGTRLAGHVEFTPVGLAAELGAGYFLKTYVRPEIEDVLSALKERLEAQRAKKPARKRT